MGAAHGAGLSGLQGVRGAAPARSGDPGFPVCRRSIRRCAFCFKGKESRCGSNILSVISRNYPFCFDVKPIPLDVDPVTRQFLTRVDDVFGGLFNLTLCDKLVWGQVPERAMRAALIIVEPLRFDNGLCLGE